MQEKKKDKIVLDHSVDLLTSFASVNSNKPLKRYQKEIILRLKELQQCMCVKNYLPRGNRIFLSRKVKPIYIAV